MRKNNLYEIITVVICILTPVVVFLGDYIYMGLADLILSANSYNATQAGSTVTLEAEGLDPKEMAMWVSASTGIAITKFAFLASYLIVTPIAIWVLKCRSKWFYITLWIFSICLYLPFVPLGTILSLFIITHLVRKKSEYYGVQNS